MTDTSHLSNRTTKRASLRTLKQRRKPDASTLRQRRIERERDARDRTAELIEKRGTSGVGVGQQLSVLETIMEYVEENWCGWYLAVVGVMVGIVIGVLLRIL